MIDQSKLTPLPVTAEWDGEECDVWDRDSNIVGMFYQRCADAEFYVLARNAFDVMMRRGWSVHRFGGYSANPWFVIDEQREQLSGAKWHADPFTALIEADKWMTAQGADTTRRGNGGAPK